MIQVCAIGVTLNSVGKGTSKGVHVCTYFQHIVQQLQYNTRSRTLLKSNMKTFLLDPKLVGFQDYLKVS